MYHHLSIGADKRRTLPGLVCSVCVCVIWRVSQTECDTSYYLLGVFVITQRA